MVSNEDASQELARILDAIERYNGHCDGDGWPGRWSLVLQLGEEVMLLAGPPISKPALAANSKMQ
jgi:hypothetical protein